MKAIIPKHALNDHCDYETFKKRLAYRMMLRVAYGDVGSLTIPWHKRALRRHIRRNYRWDQAELPRPWKKGK